MKIKSNSRKRSPFARRLKAGFSLVELLVVIAIIGIIAAIAIPNIANITGSATSSKNLRNAQSVASTFSAAQAAGWDPDTATTPVADVPTAIDAMVAGVTHNGMSFQVPLSATEVTALKADAGSLTYADATETLTYAP